MIKFQQSQALTSHFESFWSIVQEVAIRSFILQKLTLMMKTMKTTTTMTMMMTKFFFAKKIYQQLFRNSKLG